MDPWRLLIIVSDMMYHVLKDVLSVTGGCSASVTFSLTGYCGSAASYFILAVILTTVLNLAHLRSAVH